MQATPASAPRREVLAGAVMTVGCALAWLYLIYMAWGMANMDVGVDMVIMPRMTSWQLPDVGLVFAMWAIMMIAMMLPAATPTILLFAALGRHLESPRPRAIWIAFVAGYILVWSAFSLVATLAQWGLLEARLVTPMILPLTVGLVARC